MGWEMFLYNAETDDNHKCLPEGFCVRVLSTAEGKHSSMLVISGHSFSRLMSISVSLIPFTDNFVYSQ